MSRQFWRTSRFSSMGFLMAVGIMITAPFCEPGGAITYRNATNETLFIQGVVPQSELRPGEETTVDYIASDDDLIKIVINDESGCIVWTREATFGELRREDLTVTITQDMLPPKDQRTNCSGVS